MGTADTAQPINDLMESEARERFVGIREVMSHSDTAQASTDFTNHESKEWFTKLREGRQKFFRQLRDRNNIPETICAWCGKKPARSGYETCRDCAEASEKASRLYAI